MLFRSFQLVPLDDGPLTLTDDFSVALGDDAVFTFESSSQQWAANVDSSPVAPLASVAAPPWTCLLVQFGSCLALYANGQLVFGVQSAASGPPALTTGANAVGIANLVVLGSLSVMAQFNDATGAGRQTQTASGSDYLVSQIVRDGCANPIVQTKTAPGSFGSGGGQPWLTYRPGFLDVDSFVAGLGGEALMVGDVNDWYDGTNGTDDEGYPYSRILCEPSPLARPLEVGRPGAAQAIIDVATTLPASRATPQYRYGPYDGAALPYGLSLQAGMYRVVTQIGPTKSTQASFFDARGNLFARCMPGQPAADQPILSTTAVAYGDGVATTTLWLPSYYSLGDTAQQTATVADALGRVLSQTTPDGGTVQMLYAEGGNLRFAQDPQAAAQGLVSYFIWDELGRRVSRGTVAATWDPAALQVYANDPTWPENPSGPTHQPLMHWSYDGDGSDPNAVGRLVERTSFGNGFVTIETYAWSDSGLPRARTTEIVQDGSSLGTFAFEYQFDLQKRLTSISYPCSASSGLEAVTYAYDGWDRLLSATDQAGASIAAFSYNCVGDPITWGIGPSSDSATFSWDSACRLLGATIQTATAQLTSTQTYNLDGTIDVVDDVLSGAMNDQASVTYGYDPWTRLLSASDSWQKRSLSVGFTNLDGVIDQNGNIQSLTVQSMPEASVSYEPGTNEIAAINGGLDTVSYTYLPNGLVESRSASGSLDGLGFSYLPGTARVAAIDNHGSGQTIVMAYDGDGRRVLKQASGQPPQLSVRSGSTGPLLTVDTSGTATAYVYGPYGLAAMYRGGTSYGVFCDATRTSRAVFDSSGVLIAAYCFNVLGLTVASTEPSPGFLPFLFGGHELDPETGLYYFGARFFEPQTGRFLGPDPKQENASPYVYARNLPNMYFDPSGEASAEALAGLDLALLAVVLGATVLTAGAASVAIPAVAAAAGWGMAMAVGAGIGAVGGAVSGAALKGFEYTVSTPPGQWSASSFGTSVRIGAEGGGVGGAVGGAIGGGLTAELGAAGSEASAVADADAPTDAADLAGSSEDMDAGPPDQARDNSEQSAAQQQVSAQPDATAQNPQPQSDSQSAFNKFKGAGGLRKTAIGLVSKGVGGVARGATEQYLTNLLSHPSGHDVLRSGLIFGLVGGIFGGIGGGAMPFMSASGLSATLAANSVTVAAVGVGLTYSAYGGLVVWEQINPYGAD